MGKGDRLTQSNLRKWVLFPFAVRKLLCWSEKVIGSQGTPRVLSLRPAPCMSVLWEVLASGCVLSLTFFPSLCSSTLYPLLDYLVFCFPRALAHSAPRWPGCCLVAPLYRPLQLPHLLVASFIIYSLQVTQRDWSHLSFTPSHMMDCRPGHSLAAVGSRVHLWSNSWEDGLV